MSNFTFSVFYAIKELKKVLKVTLKTKNKSKKGEFMNLPVRNLICLRDPNFEKHEWHAGHITCIRVTSARQDYKNRRRAEEVGGKAYRIIRDMEYYWKMRLTHTQKYMLYVYISNALWVETMFLNSKNS